MDWLQILVPSLLIVIGGLAGWVVRSRTEEHRAMREKLREEQRGIYKKILEPYIEILANPQNTHFVNDIKSTYRKTAFELILVGSDNVVLAYNKIMRYAYKAEESGEKSPMDMMELWGSLLLEIRKSLGHKSTKLKPVDMLRGMITDIDKYLRQYMILKAKLHKYGAGGIKKGEAPLRNSFPLPLSWGVGQRVRGW